MLAGILYQFLGFNAREKSAAVELGSAGSAVLSCPAVTGYDLLNRSLSGHPGPSFSFHLKINIFK